MVAVMRDMIQRKKVWEAETQRDFKRAREEAVNCYARNIQDTEL